MSNCIYYEVEMVDKRTGKPTRRELFGSLHKSQVEAEALKLNDARTQQEAHQIEFRCSEPKKHYRVSSV